VVHAVALLGDSYLSPSLADITIPSVSGYQRGWTTLGIVAGWAMLILGLSYYARNRIGRRWRTVHRFTALAWLTGLVHSLGDGTDSGEAWFVAAVAIVVLPALALLAIRMFGGQRRPRTTRTSSGGPVVRSPGPAVRGVRR
jgi:sulfoxide reductase heme-binding subunit YedZ